MPPGRAAAMFVALIAVAPPGFAAGAPRVAAVTFAPSDRLGSYRFADLVAVRAGDPLTPDLLERNLRLLRATGLFAEVDARLVDRPAGTEVLFTLRPHLLVKEVRVKGNFLVLERDLSRMLRLRPAEPFSEEIVRGDIERVLRYYEDQGYEGTTVAEEISRKAGEVRVTYRIGEGRRQGRAVGAPARQPRARRGRDPRRARDEPVHVLSRLRSPARARQPAGLLPAAGLPRRARRLARRRRRGLARVSGRADQPDQGAAPGSAAAATGS